MIKRYILFTLITAILMLYVLIDYIYQDSSIENAEYSFVKITTIDEIALSSSNLEDRFIYTKESINSIYPQMIKPNRWEYVYDK